MRSVRRMRAVLGVSHPLRCAQALGAVSRLFTRCVLAALAGCFMLSKAVFRLLHSSACVVHSTRSIEAGTLIEHCACFRAIMIWNWKGESEGRRGGSAWFHGNRGAKERLLGRLLGDR